MVLLVVLVVVGRSRVHDAYSKATLHEYDVLTTGQNVLI
jgi:hypothetical protein